MDGPGCTTHVHDGIKYRTIWYSLESSCSILHCLFTLKGSVFGPNVMYSLSHAASEGGVAPLPSFAQSSHFIGQILGGILGGKIMQHVFSDNE